MKVFISHAQQDRTLADDLAARLSDAGYEVWRAEEQLLPGENWALKIGQALEESDAMVVLVSPESVRSQSVREEINYALGSPNYAGRVIPVLVRPTAEMPWVFRKLNVVPAGKSRVKLGNTIINALQQTPA